MTQFKKGDDVAWIVKYIKHDTTHAATYDGVSVSLETSPGSTVLVHNPQLHPVSALDVNKGLLEACKEAREYFYPAGPTYERLCEAIASAEKGV